MKRYALFGAGALCPMVQELLAACPHMEQPAPPVLLFDDNPALWGREKYGLAVRPSADIDAADFDAIIICSLNSAAFIAEKLMREHHVPEAKIDRSFSEMLHYMRERFVVDFAKTVYADGLCGDTAEGGVLRGDFAAMISRQFPDRDIWLFDTFERFTPDDVLGRMPYPQHAICRQGLFPATARADAALGARSFVFVNLDFNLYAPTLDGLIFFYPKLVRGGVILVHDALISPKVHRAAAEFCADMGIRPLPIGDGFSVAIHKF